MMIPQQKTKGEGLGHWIGPIVIDQIYDICITNPDGPYLTLDEGLFSNNPVWPLGLFLLAQAAL